MTCGAKINKRRKKEITDNNYRKGVMKQKRMELKRMGKQRNSHRMFSLRLI